MKQERTHPSNTWRHPGGKLIEEGADKLTDSELLSILIGTGTKEKSAEKIADEIIRKFGGYKGMANQPLEKFIEFKGLGDVKIVNLIKQNGLVLQNYPNGLMKLQKKEIFPLELLR
jgi:DNA repair protein RadC